MREYLSRRYGTPFSPHAVERYSVAGGPEECAERVRAYAAAGVTDLVFNPAVPAARLAEQIEALADAVLAVAT
jgi:alkanesulfonate monooxygenase SsuD/methylene tetrahydromethanopterin reductase-like flavin-dependent oxidoreductase (luciferase family)